MPPRPARSVDILLRRTFTRLVWGVSGAMVLIAAVQWVTPSLPRSQGAISLGLAGALALLNILLRRRHVPRMLQDRYWLLTVLTIAISMALRAWVDPHPNRPWVLLILLPVAGLFIQGRRASLLLWSALNALALLAWAWARPPFHRPDLFLVNLVFFTAFGIWLQHHVGDLIGRMEARILRLAEARREIRTLEGMIPICAHCKRVRNDAGYWEQVEGYLTRHQLARFSHGICPSCLETVREENRAILGPHGSRPPSA